MIDLATVRPLLGVSDPTRAGGVPVAGEVLTRDPDRVAGEVAYTVRSLLVAFSAGLRPARSATSRSRPCRSRLDLMQGRQLMHRARPVPRPVCDVRLSGRHHRAPPLHHRVLDPPATPDTAGGGASGRCRSPFRPPRWAGCRDRLELRRVPGRALGRDFRNRGARQGEQIQLLRRFFTQSVGDFPGRYHRADRAHSHPNRRTPNRSGPAGSGEAAFDRAARLARTTRSAGAGHDGRQLLGSRSWVVRLRWKNWRLFTPARVRGFVCKNVRRMSTTIRIYPALDRRCLKGSGHKQ